MYYSISHPNQVIEGTVKLPASKSISNRALILQALSDSPYAIANLSDSDDTRVLEQVLRSNTNVSIERMQSQACLGFAEQECFDLVSAKPGLPEFCRTGETANEVEKRLTKVNYFDIGHAGTTMRFLTAFLSRIAGEWTLTGSARMKQRPIRILVDALRTLGARIEYPEEEGYPPLKIWGSHLQGGVLELDGSISSQYISALLMIGPVIEGGLTLKLLNRVTSRTYLELTLNLMRQFGIRYEWQDNEIRIAEQTYQPAALTVEADWSGASYWYQILSLAKKGELELPDLQLPGIQGDAVIARWFESFGITSQDTGHSVIIRKTTDRKPAFLQLDFIGNPDMAQTMAVLCVLKKVPFHFTGLETLKIKETDRIKALQQELAKFGAAVREPGHGELSWDASFSLPKSGTPVISTYHDHRMALAFAPAALYGEIAIEDPMVVTKSYPSYYDDLKQVGFNVRMSEC